MPSLTLDPRQRRLAALFGLLGNGLPILIAIATVGSHAPTVFYLGAAVASVVPLVVTLVPRERSPVVFYLAAYSGLPALTLLQADTGGVASGNSVLLLMAMIWFGLQASDRELLIGLGLLAACSFLPMVVVGAPAYPVSWGYATLLVIVGAAVSGSLRTLARETATLTEQLRTQAMVDDLTGLLNRRGWNDAAERRFAEAERGEHTLAVALIDLDEFKRVNDTLGHDEGDRVLRETADRLRISLPDDAELGRLGGDEFVGLLVHVDPDSAIGALTRLARASPDNGRFSAGVAMWDGSETLSELMRRADIALYEAKTSGGGGTVSRAPRRVDSRGHPI